MGKMEKNTRKENSERRTNDAMGWMVAKYLDDYVGVETAHLCQIRTHTTFLKDSYTKVRSSP